MTDSDKAVKLLDETRAPVLGERTVRAFELLANAVWGAAQSDEQPLSGEDAIERAAELLVELFGAEPVIVRRAADSAYGRLYPPPRGEYTPQS